MVWESGPARKVSREPNYFPSSTFDSLLELACCGSIPDSQRSLLLADEAMKLHNLDPLTLRIVVQIHLDDLRELANATADRKGKGRAGEVSDASVAIEAYQTELSRQAQLLTDISMCRSISDAVAADAEVISTLALQEEREAQDRRMAMQLADRIATGDNSTSRPASKTADEDIYGVPAPSRPTTTTHAESSLRVATRHNGTSGISSKEPDCVVCGEKHYSNIVLRECPHTYCRSCLVALFEASTRDEALFPPKCCRIPIPIDICRPLLSPTLTEKVSWQRN